MNVSFELIAHFPVKPSTLYAAWLNSNTHSEMTGGEAICSTEVGGEFSAWDGYISGKNKSLVLNMEIVQSWRTTEFGEDDKASEIILRFEETEAGCKLTLIHSNIPEGQSDYAMGWANHYFNPMKSYFEDK